MNGGAGTWLLLALAAMIPLIALALTSFVKISVVLSLLRNALGTPEAPSSLIVTGMALIITGFVMAPVGARMVAAATEEPSAAVVAAPRPELALLPGDVRARVPMAERGLVPLRDFLKRHASATDRATFVELAGELGSTVTGDELWVIAPAFLTTELKSAFAIAVILFLPFMVIEIIVNLSLSSMGLTTISPNVISLPLKLALFVAVDGWRLLIAGLVKGYV